MFTQWLWQLGGRKSSAVSSDYSVIMTINEEAEKHGWSKKKRNFFLTENYGEEIFESTPPLLHWLGNNNTSYIVFLQKKSKTMWQHPKNHNMETLSDMSIM